MKDIIDRMIEYWGKKEAVELGDIRDTIKNAILEDTDDLVKRYIVAQKKRREQKERLRLYGLVEKGNDKV